MFLFPANPPIGAEVENGNARYSFDGVKWMAAGLVQGAGTVSTDNVSILGDGSQFAPLTADLIDGGQYNARLELAWPSNSKFFVSYSR